MGALGFLCRTAGHSFLNPFADLLWRIRPEAVVTARRCCCCCRSGCPRDDGSRRSSRKEGRQGRMARKRNTDAYCREVFRGSVGLSSGTVRDSRVHSLRIVEAKQGGSRTETPFLNSCLRRPQGPRRLDSGPHDPLPLPLAFPRVLLFLLAPQQLVGGSGVG